MSIPSLQTITKEPPQPDEQQQQQRRAHQQGLLINEQPNMDTALKNFASWFMVYLMSNYPAAAAATTTSSTEKWTNADVLNVTRWLSRSINRHIVSIAASSTEANTMSRATTHSNETADLVALVWNDIVSQGNKVSKVLGRTSLKVVWKDLDLMQQLDDTQHGSKDEASSLNPEKARLYVQYFERFLFGDSTTATTAASLGADDATAVGPLPDLVDARLIWDADRGQGELARRATQRQEQAAQRRLEMVADTQQDDDDDRKPSASSVVITEITDHE